MTTDEPLKRGEIHSEEHGVTVKWEAHSHWLAFQSKTGYRQPDGSVLYMADDEMGVLMPADGFEKGERFVDGSVKWDGCSHLNFGDDDGYVHLCGASSYLALMWVLREAFAIAAREVPAWDHGTAGTLP